MQTPLSSYGHHQGFHGMAQFNQVSPVSNLHQPPLNGSSQLGQGCSTLDMQSQQFFGSSQLNG
ncbi:putative protein FAR1-RELATED SEQUENCE 5 [Cocos nucifera]|uniref:Uncharacterized protein n=1 Tax=Cocos nucifera TaxID=13894 RepID=A0A8K0MYH5_COCNU|nr:putative protein FAR1-RELATED SEQUENCE 5 [Cocos nucifera]